MIRFGGQLSVDKLPGGRTIRRGPVASHHWNHGRTRVYEHTRLSRLRFRTLIVHPRISS